MQMLCNPQYKNICSVIQITKISVCKFEHLQQCPGMIFLCQWISACFSSAIFLKTN